LEAVGLLGRAVCLTSQRRHNEAAAQALRRMHKNRATHCQEANTARSTRCLSWPTFCRWGAFSGAAVRALAKPGFLAGGPAPKLLRRMAFFACHAGLALRGFNPTPHEVDASDNRDCCTR
jgi:hypothetical protein